MSLGFETRRKITNKTDNDQRNNDHYDKAGDIEHLNPWDIGTIDLGKNIPCQIERSRREVAIGIGHRDEKTGRRDGVKGSQQAIHEDALIGHKIKITATPTQLSIRANVEESTV